MFSRISRPLIKCLLKRVKIDRCIASGLSLFFCVHALAGEVVEKTLAVINNEAILLSDLKKLEKKIAKESSMIDDLLLFETPLPLFKKDPAKQLQYLIYEKIMDSEVKRNNLTVTMEKVDQEIRDIAKRNQVTKEILLSSILQQGMSLSDYQNFMKLRIERQSLIEQEVTSKIRLADEDILAFYANQKGHSAVTVFEYDLSHIFFPAEGIDGQAAFEKAQKAFSQLRSGENFDKLSALLNKNDQNGILGIFKTGEFAPEMEKAVVNLNIGESSAVVKGRKGFHILKLNGKRMVADPEFEKNKEKYKALLMDKVFKRQFKAWLDRKREEALIKIN